MDARHVVSVITGSDSDSDWNSSDEERDGFLEEELFQMDRLTMEQGKMAATRGIVNLLYLLYKASDVLKKMMAMKMEEITTTMEAMMKMEEITTTMEAVKMVKTTTKMEKTMKWMIATLDLRV